MIKLSEQLDCALITMERWITRYQIRGLIGLTAKHNPIKEVPPEYSPPDLGALSPEELAIGEEKRKILGELLNKTFRTNKEIKECAERAGKVPRTIRKWLNKYDKYGPASLAPKRRSDRGSRHKITPRMVEIIKGIRLSRLDAPTHYVHKQAQQRAKQLGENQPSLNQVRNIIASIPRKTRQIADGRRREYANSFEITAPINFGTEIVYMFDTNITDVLVVDKRPKKYRTKSGEVRPHLILGLEARSRCIVVAKLFYDSPNTLDVGESFRQAFLDWGHPRKCLGR